MTSDGRAVFAIQEPGGCRLTSVGDNKWTLLRFAATAASWPSAT